MRMQALRIASWFRAQHSYGIAGHQPQAAASKRVGLHPGGQLFLVYLPVLLSFIPRGFAQYYFSYNAEVQSAYEQLMDLNLPAAAQQLEHLAQSQPDNLARLHLQDYHAFLQVYTSDEEALYQQLKKNRQTCLRMLELGPADSPWTLYTQADVRLHWAYLKFQFGDYFAGFLEVKKAFHLLEKNQQRFPEFTPNYKHLGILYTLIGTVPDQYQWGIRMLSGLEGSVEQGQKALDRSLEPGQPATTFLTGESRLLYSYLLVYLGWDYEAAWRLLRPLQPDSSRPVLATFIYANVAFRSGHNDEAIQALQAVRQRAGWQHFPALSFQLGSALLRKLDPEAASWFQDFLERYRGRQDIKAAHHRLAWCALLQDDPITYHRQMRHVQQRGMASSGLDKDALRAAELDFIPQVYLLRARLLFDGGYLPEALRALQQLTETELAQTYEKLELNYRKGRIHQGMKHWDKALVYFGTVYQKGVTDGYYFACNAALQMGLIEEQRGHWEEAIGHFERCLSAKAEVYQNSLHMAAKAGRQRAKNNLVLKQN